MPFLIYVVSMWFTRTQEISLHISVTELVERYRSIGMTGKPSVSMRIQVLLEGKVLTSSQLNVGYEFSQNLLLNNTSF